MSLLVEPWVRKSFDIIGGSWQIFRKKLFRPHFFSCCTETKYERLCFLEIFQNPCAINVGEFLSYVNTRSLFPLSILWGSACFYFGFWVNTWNLLEVHCLQISHHAPFFPRGKLWFFDKANLLLFFFTVFYLVSCFHSLEFIQLSGKVL